MTRTRGWSAVRWSEFAVLGLALALAVVETVQSGPVPLDPKVLAALALASKALRAILRVVGRRQSSTVDPISWLVAVLLAVLAGIGSEIGTGSQDVPHAPEVLQDGNLRDVPTAPDIGPCPGDPIGGADHWGGPVGAGDVADGSNHSPAVE